MRIRLTPIICWILVLTGFFYTPGHARSDFVEDTSLLFVGEDEKLLSIGSRKEESAWQVPAVATVIDREAFGRQGMQTLADVLDTLPGFYVQSLDSGTRLYLRGISDSALVLYDTVPLASFTEKSLNLIDTQLPLSAVRQVEVVRGPGSMLWGPDAFAGIVNVVPLTGKDFSGVQTGLMYDSEDSLTRAHVNMGKKSQNWDGFLSVNAGRTGDEDFSDDITRFFGEGTGQTGDIPVSQELRYGENHDFSKALDISGNLNYKSWFSATARFMDSRTPYSLSTEDLSWKEVREVTSSFLKLEGKHRIDLDSSLRFTGAVSSLKNTKQVIDMDLDQEQTSFYGEIAYEKTFNSGQSHFASGLSIRDTEYKGIPVWDSYLPDYLCAENQYFLPQVAQYNFNTQLLSAFGQYRMTIRSVELVAGIRFDRHDAYENQCSYNAGFVWAPSDFWVVKGLFGTAYRTPHAIQQIDQDDPGLEKIKSVNLLTTWKPDEKITLSWCAFANEIDNHVKEDPYAGLSSPNSQEILGLELSAGFSPVPSVTITANASFLDNSGPDETFNYIEYYIQGEGGALEPVWGTLFSAYDTGPDRLFNLNIQWAPETWLDLFCRVRFFSSYDLTYPHAQSPCRSENTWLLDAGVRLKNKGFKNCEWGLTFNNIGDTEYMVPGTYSMEKGSGFSILLFWKKIW